MCETQWAGGADSLYTFRTAYPVVVQSLETLSEDGDGKARGCLCSIKQLISSSPLLLLNMYFLTQSPYKRCFKESNVNLIEAAEEVSVVINVMNTERNDPSVWKELYEQGKQLAANVDNTQQHRANRDFKQ